VARLCRTGRRTGETRLSSLRPSLSLFTNGPRQNRHTRRPPHAAQYFDPDAAPIAEADAKWAIEKAAAALAGVKRLLTPSPAEQEG